VPDPLVLVSLGTGIPAVDNNFTIQSAWWHASCTLKSSYTHGKHSCYSHWPGCLQGYTSLCSVWIWI